jgi:hypothetical protein
LLDFEPVNVAVDLLDAACGEFFGVIRLGHESVSEIEDVVGLLSEQQRLMNRSRTTSQHADSLVSNLPPVTVRAMQDVMPPTRAHSLEIGQLVDYTDRDKDPPRLRRSAIAQDHHEVLVVSLGANDFAT